MKELIIEPFESRDLVDIKIRPEQKIDFANVDRVSLGNDLKKAPGYSWTARDIDEKLVFVAGIIELWPGTGELWLVCDMRIRLYAREAYGYCKHLLEHTMDLMSLARVQSRVRPDWEVAVKFAERMEFEREGLLKKYKYGRDYYLYARVR